MCAWPKSRQMPTARLVELTSSSDEVHERSGARQLVRNHFDGDLDAERRGEPLQFLDAAPRAPLAAVLAGDA